MKRVNPETNKLFVRGDTREDGLIFHQYQTKKLRKTGFFGESWLCQEAYERHNFAARSGKCRTAASVATRLLCQAKGRCNGIPSRTAAGRPATNGRVTINRDWIEQRINAGVCEATGDALTTEPKHKNTVSLDRINSDNPDYTPENARIVTWQFNNMKGNYSDEEFIRVAKALENENQRKSASVPA